MSELPAKVLAARERRLPHVTITDLIEFTEPVPADRMAILNGLVEPFALVPEARCPGCSLQTTGLLGTFRWGIVNGEGYCGECGWPMRAYHRTKEDGMDVFLPMVLPYHPDVVRLEGEEEHGDR